MGSMYVVAQDVRDLASGMPETVAIVRPHIFMRPGCRGRGGDGDLRDGRWFLYPHRL